MRHYNKRYRTGQVILENKITISCNHRKEGCIMFEFNATTAPFLIKGVMSVLLLLGVFLMYTIFSKITTACKYYRRSAWIPFNKYRCDTGETECF